MDKIIFTEEFCQPENLFPFTLTRQVQDIRVGILTIREKWEKMLGLKSFDKKVGRQKSEVGRKLGLKINDQPKISTKGKTQTKERNRFAFRERQMEFLWKFADYFD